MQSSILSPVDFQGVVLWPRSNACVGFKFWRQVNGLYSSPESDPSEPLNHKVSVYSNNPEKMQYYKFCIYTGFHDLAVWHVNIYQGDDPNCSLSTPFKEEATGLLSSGTYPVVQQSSDTILDIGPGLAIIGGSNPSDPDLSTNILNREKCHYKIRVDWVDPRTGGCYSWDPEMEVNVWDGKGPWEE